MNRNRSATSESANLLVGKLLLGLVVAIVLGACSSQSDPSSASADDPPPRADRGPVIEENPDPAINSNPLPVVQDVPGTPIVLDPDSGEFADEAGVGGTWRSDLVPLYPGVVVADAVLDGDQGVRLFVVTMTTDDSPETVSAFYEDSASRFNPFTFVEDGEYAIAVVETDFSYSVDIFPSEGGAEISVTLLLLR